MRTALALVTCVVTAAVIHAAAQTPAPGALYTNAAFGYSVEYPLGWTIAFLPTEGGARISPPAKDGVWIAVRAADAGDDLTLHDLVNAYEQAMATDPPTDLGRLVDTARRLSLAPPPELTTLPPAPAPATSASLRSAAVLGSGPALRVTFTSKAHVAVLAFRDGMVHSLQFVAPASTLPLYVPYFDQVVQSFRFQARLKRGN